MSGVLTKRCLTCNRPVLTFHRGVVSPAQEARVEKVEANGDVVGLCRCGRRVVWLKARHRTAPIITTG